MLIGLTTGTAHADFVTRGGVTVFFDGESGGEADWRDAIRDMGRAPVFSGEDFNDEPLTPTAGPTSRCFARGLEAGPHSLGGAANDEFTLTFNDVGSGGSYSGITSMFTPDRALKLQISDDTSDQVIIPDFLVLAGVGVQSCDLDFARPQIGWAAQFYSTTQDLVFLQEGLQINVNGVEIDLNDFYPELEQVGGAGFLGLIDVGGISRLTFVTDQLDARTPMEQVVIDDIQYAWSTAIESGLRLSLESIDFGSHGVGTSASREFTVRNVGTSDLEITRVALGGDGASEYRIVSGGGPGTLEPGGLRLVNVAFEPAAVGVADAAVAIDSDDVVSPTVSVRLTGSGDVPGGLQVPGDCNQDGELDVSDGLCLLGIFFGRASRLPCEDDTPWAPGNVTLLDGNGDGGVDLSDAVRVFSYLFLGGSRPVLGEECVAIEGCPSVCVP